MYCVVQQVGLWYVVYLLSLCFYCCENVFNRDLVDFCRSMPNNNAFTLCAVSLFFNVPGTDLEAWPRPVDTHFSCCSRGLY